MMGWGTLGSSMFGEVSAGEVASFGISKGNAVLVEDSGLCRL